MSYQLYYNPIVKIAAAVLVSVGFVTAFVALIYIAKDHLHQYTACAWVLIVFTMGINIASFFDYKKRFNGLFSICHSLSVALLFSQIEGVSGHLGGCDEICIYYKTFFSGNVAMFVGEILHLILTSPPDEFLDI